MREFGRSFTPAVIDAVVGRKTFAYSINHTDNAQLIDIFTFGTYGGILLGGDSYGQMTNFNFDCVAVGIHKLGNSDFNRNWQVAQGSIIANTGESVENIHPIIAEGKGHLAIANVEAFSGTNAALSTVGKSFDFMLVRGNERTTVSMFGCRMRNYTSSLPLRWKTRKHAYRQWLVLTKTKNLSTEASETPADRTAADFRTCYLFQPPGRLNVAENEYLCPL